LTSLAVCKICSVYFVVNLFVKARMFKRENQVKILIVYLFN
jgi:hypothetical protein